jgi:hypothetical protein
MAPDISELSDDNSNVENNARTRRVSNANDGNNNQSTLNHSNSRKEEFENSRETFKPQIRWPDLIVQIALHVGSLYGLYCLVTLKAKLYTYLWCE